MIALQLAVLVAVAAQGSDACPTTATEFCKNFGKTDGFYPNPCDNTCKTYFRCWNGGASSLEATCQSGLAFNPSSQVCDFDFNFKCESGSGAQSPAGPHASPAPVSPARASPAAPPPVVSPTSCNVDPSQFCQAKAPGSAHPHPCDATCLHHIYCDCSAGGSVKTCSSGLVFNANSAMCDLPANYKCPTQPASSPAGPPPQNSPQGPPAQPSPQAQSPSPRPPLPSPIPAASPGAGLPEPLGSILRATQTKDILKWEYATGQYKPSTVYIWEDMLTGLTQMYNVGVGQSKFWLGDSSPNGHLYGAVSVAAFLAQSMKETIKYNACDENNWDQHPNFASTFGSKPTLLYTSASACGQLEQSYQDYKCGSNEPVEDMACEVDPNMQIRAVTSATWYGAPPPLFCAPKSKVPVAYAWDTNGWCKTTDPNPGNVPSYDTDMTFDEYIEYMKKGPNQANPEDWNTRCRDYVGQQGGEWGGTCGGGGCPSWGSQNFQRPNRTDVEGCCWWGRGVIQTTGVCNFGKLNYYLGARAAREGRTAMFPEVDFCRDPEAICASTKHPELKWIAGFYYFMTEVQPWNAQGFDYLIELRAFVDSGMKSSDTKFIDAVSAIVNRGCPDLKTCPAGEVDGVWDRQDNFRKVLMGMGLVSF